MGEGLFEEIKGYLESRGLRLREGTIVDPPSYAVVHQEPGSLTLRSQTMGNQ